MQGDVWLERLRCSMWVGTGISQRLRSTGKTLVSVRYDLAVKVVVRLCQYTCVFGGDYMYCDLL